MHKLWLIIQREFSTRVRKKSFVIMTLIGPLLLAGIMFLPAYLASLPGDEKVVVVLDHAELMDMEAGKGEITYNYLPPREFNREGGLNFFKESTHYAYLYIPGGDVVDPDYSGKNAMLYAKGDVNLKVQSDIEGILEKNIQKEKLRAQGVDPEIIARTKSRVALKTFNVEKENEQESATKIKMIIGYAAGFLIYIFVFLYGAQVMRGVIEEKTSRIVEVMISSVRPFDLMLGKILGIGGVALLQFIVWLLCGIAFYAIAVTFIIGDALDPAKLSQGAPVATDNFAFELQRSLESIPFAYLISTFLFFFVMGYLLYAAIFAAIGAAVDKEADTQQFMLPVSLPLLASIMVLIRALGEPNGALATGFSLFPLTSPVVMMARAPFGVPLWQMLLSMGILILTFLGTTWAAGRIYRTGILMYGKKPSVKELFKWIGYSK
jgi:ABC-2 type transport system permease protein